MTKAISPRAIAFLCVLLITSVLYAGCTRPYAIPLAEWNTSPDKCAKCHANDLIFKKPQIAGHAEIHCLECHAVNNSHFERRELGFDGTYENVAINEGRCLLCHPADRYSNPGHWQHLGERAKHNGSPMRCIDCHTEGHELSNVIECSECHKETEDNAQMMASGHCTICHGFKGTSILGKSRGDYPYDSSRCGVCHILGDISTEQDVDSFRAALIDPHIAKSSCGTCHTPHQSEDPSEEITCKNCHKANKLNLVAAHNISGHQSLDCLTCHTPHHFGITGDSSCELCHGEDFSGIMKSDSNLHQDCNTCHEKGDFSSIIPDSCKSCHSDEATACSQSDIKRDCLLCHAPHSWQASWDGCMSCHDGIKSGLHPQHIDFGCVSCHVKHNWSPRKRNICLECHTDYKDHMDSSMLCVDCHWSR
jgi:hypothetical protein